MGLKVRYHDFRTVTRAQTLSEPTDLTAEIWKAAAELFENRLPSSLPLVRLLGVGLTGLERSSERQALLFNGDEQIRQSRLDQVTDQIQERFGQGAIGRAAAIHREDKSEG